MIVDPNVKQCRTCEKVKTLSEFSADKRLKSGLSFRCKECNSRICKEYRNSQVAKEPVPHKECPDCKMIKSKDEFYKIPSRSDGLAQRCVECSRRAKRVEYVKYKNKYKDNDLRKRYGITLEDYMTLIDLQDGLCAICRSPSDTNFALCVDHNHQTGEVRGLLCNRCNRALGMFGDDINVLIEAIIYLSKSGGGEQPF